MRAEEGADLAGHRGVVDRLPHPQLRPHQADHDVAIDLEQQRGGGCDNGVAAPTPGDQRHLAEKLARPEIGDLRRIIRIELNPDLAVKDRVQRVRVFAAPHDHIADRRCIDVSVNQEFADL